MRRGTGATAVTMGCSLRQMSIGNETSKSARTCSLGTKRCGDGPFGALPPGGICVSSLAASGSGLDATLGSASYAALRAASACSAIEGLEAAELDSLSPALLASLVSVLASSVLVASVLAASGLAASALTASCAFA